MTAELLKIVDLHKAYRKGDQTLHVLRGANLSIGRGECLSIVGASGAGKSTLLHLLGSLDAPDRGEVYFEGRSLSGRSAAQLADFRNRSLGFVFQFHHLLGEFTALENVMMPALIRRLPRAKAHALATAALAEVQMRHREDHRPGELSGGEQQRVALARALVLQPPLLLADEVTGNLDEATGEKIHDLLFELNRRHQITLVVVTHNRKLAERMARRLVLVGGQIEEKN